jgi:hypothetical protein
MLLLANNTLPAQTYRPEHYQDGRSLRQGKFLISAGWGLGGIGFTAIPENVTANPPTEPRIENPALGTLALGLNVGLADNIDFGFELGGTRGGLAYTVFLKSAFFPYSSPFQIALLGGVSACPAEINFGLSLVDRIVDSVLQRPSPSPYYVRSNMTTLSLTAPISYDISPEWTLIAEPRIHWANYDAGVGSARTAPNGLSAVDLTFTSTSAWFYGFTIGAKAVRPEPLWWQYLVPVPFLASGCMQMSFLWSSNNFFTISLSYQHLFPTFGTLLTTVTQDEMNTIQADRRTKDSLLAEQKLQLELERSRLGRALSADIISVKGMDGKGVAVENPTVRVEEFEAQTSLPLLPYIFFEQNSFVLPSRYRRIRAADRLSFTMEHFARLKPSEMYRNILNIIGKRMNTVSSATITLVGTTSGLAEEAGNTELAERRAIAVQNYLVDVWKIAPQRIIIQTRPKQDTVGLRGEIADTRRVEISASEPEILADVSSQEIIPSVTPEKIVFGFDIAAGAGLKQWNLEVTQLAGTEVRTLKYETGTDSNINKYTWNIAETRASVPISGENISARLEVTDLTNRVVESALALVPVEYISVEQKRRSGNTDMKRTLLQRWLFGFEGWNSPNTAQERVLDNVALQEIQSLLSSESEIIARTSLGTQERTSLQNALKSALKLPVQVLEGQAPTIPQTPEDRFYARCVAFEIRTPMARKN